MAHKRLVFIAALAVVAMIVVDAKELPSDEQRLAELVNGDPPDEKVETILNSFTDKTIEIGESKVIHLVRVIQTDLSMEDCQYDAISWRQYHTMNSKLDSVPSVYRLAKRRYDELLAFCKENYENIYQGFEQLKVVNASRLAASETRKMLDLIKDKVNVKIGALNVETILDQADETEPKLEDCKRGELDRRISYRKLVNSEHLISNMARFDEKARKQLFELCAAKSKEAVAAILTEEDKKLIEKSSLGKPGSVDGPCSRVYFSLALIMILENEFGMIFSETKKIHNLNRLDSICEKNLGI